MADIEKLIQDLQSDDLENKYNACKQLKNEPQLPEEAIEALHVASNDPEPLIAATANRALENYEPNTTSFPHNESHQHEKYYDDQQSSGISWDKVFYIGFAAIIAFLSSCGISELSMRDTPFYSEELEAFYSFVPLVPLFYFCGLALSSSVIASSIAVAITSYWGHRMNTALDVLLPFFIGLICGIGLYIISLYLFWI